MTLLRPQTGPIPRPRPSLQSQPFWDGARRRQLVFQRCGECQAPTHTPALVCSRCGAGSLSWEASSGRGVVYSWTTVWRPQTPAFTVPYTPIIVDVEEGWQMLSNLIGCEHDAAQVGLRVQVEFHRLDDDITLPYFRPA